VRGVEGRGRGWGARGRNDPNNVCTYEYMSKEKKEDIFVIISEPTLICN
jgi:hypothetical protein